MKPKRKLGGPPDVFVEPKHRLPDAGGTRSLACGGRGCVGSRKTGRRCSEGDELQRVLDAEWCLVLMRKQEEIEAEMHVELLAAQRLALGGCNLPQDEVIPHDGPSNIADALRVLPVS